MFDSVHILLIIIYFNQLTLLHLKQHVLRIFGLLGYSFPYRFQFSSQDNIAIVSC